MRRWWFHICFAVVCIACLALAVCDEVTHGDSEILQLVYKGQHKSNSGAFAVLESMRPVGLLVQPDGAPVAFDNNSVLNCKVERKRTDYGLQSDGRLLIVTDSYLNCGAYRLKLAGILYNMPDKLPEQ